MADSSAERVARHREKSAKRDLHIAAAKKMVPDEGPRQDRAVAHAIWHMEAHERGEVAYPYPTICFDSPALPVGTGLSDERPHKAEKRAR
jgi:hypothetical protein